MSEDTPSREAYVANEGALLQGLLAAISQRDENTRTIIIEREKGKELFRFDIHGLTEDQYNECKKKGTKTHKPAAFGGLELPEKVDNGFIRSLLILAATVPEHRKLLWENQQAIKAAGVGGAAELIDKVLLAGEKARVIDVIDRLSGFDEEELVEQAKN